MTIARGIASFTSRLQFENLPEEVVEKAKQAIVDNLGNALAGCCTREGKMVTAFAKGISGEPSATLVGTGKCFFEKAAFGNAVLSRIVDLDDGHKFTTGHPGTVIIPTALTIGNMLNAPGKDIITALVAGYEVYVRIAKGINASAHKEKGYDMTGVCGAVAAAVVSGKLWKLNEDELTNAIGIAGSYTGGLYECLSDGSTPKLLVPGWAVNTGINAARLVKYEFTGPASIIEGKKGLAQGVTNWYHLEDALVGLGQEYSILGIYFKKHACMRGLHGGIDAVMSIKEKNDLAPECIEKITIYTSSYVKQYDKPYPSTLVGTQSNLPYAISVGLFHGKVGLDEMADSLNDPKIKEMMQKITIVIEPEIEEHVKSNFTELTTVRAEISTKDGNSYVETVFLASGEPENPMCNKEFKDKFFLLAGKALKDEQTAEIYQGLNRLEQLKDISMIMDTVGIIQ